MLAIRAPELFGVSLAISICRFVVDVAVDDCRYVSRCRAGGPSIVLMYTVSYFAAIRYRTYTRIDITIMNLESTDVCVLEIFITWKMVQFGTIGLRKDRSPSFNHIDACYVVLCYFRCGGTHLVVSEYQSYNP